MKNPERSIFVVLGFALLVLYAPPAAAAQAGPDPTKAEQFIRERIAQSMIYFDGEARSRATIAHRVRGELERNFDVRSIAAYALGPLREDITPDQRDRYLGAFSDWLTETVSRLVIGLRWRARATPDNLTLAGTTPLGDDQIIVHSRIRQSDLISAKVDWRLRQKEGGFLVLDVMIAGVSQANVYRSQFASFLRRQNRDIEGLIAELQARNAQLASGH